MTAIVTLSDQLAPPMDVVRILVVEFETTHSKVTAYAGELERPGVTG